ncbi:MAG: DUF4091 domain-containing protein [Candidatus Alcyoniella australis]|nr:DUF4091 domain-containing protein [Candidatus Alcyoniella australis]
MRTLPTVVLIALVVLALALPAQAALKALVVDPNLKLRPGDDPTGAAGAVLQAARNEYEPFQVVVFDDSGAALSGCDASVSALAGPEGEQIAANEITLFREWYIEVIIPSQKPIDPAASGFWPDGLIPFVDEWDGEDRDGSPFNVEAGGFVMLWVDVHIPLGQQPGDYAGSLSVTCDDKAAVQIPIELTVWDFTVPEKITGASNYGYSCGNSYNTHVRMGSSPNRDTLNDRYFAEALKHRMGISSPCYSPTWSWDGSSGSFDWTTFDAQMGPFYDGEVLPWAVELPNMRLPYGGSSTDERRAYWAAFAQHFREKGWLDKLYLYLPDEPTPAEYQNLVNIAELLHSADSELRAMATEQVDPALMGSVDIWCPDEPLFSDSLPWGPYPEDYPPRQALGEEAWMYNCMSAQFMVDYTNYFIDSQGLHARLFQWVTWRYHFTGTLYWQSNYGMRSGHDVWYEPWEDTWFCNGDGNLFYPGAPSMIGGSSDIPIASMRMKLIREGQEDYEYFRLADAMGKSEQVDTLLRSVVRKSWDWSHDPADTMRVREQIAQIILGQGDSTPPDEPGALALEAGDATISVSWTDPADADLASCAVYIGKYPDDRQWLVDVAAGTGQYIIEDLANGQTYYIALDAADQWGNRSAFTDEIAATPQGADDDDDDDDDDTGADDDDNEEPTWNGCGC